MIYPATAGIAGVECEKERSEAANVDRIARQHIVRTLEHAQYNQTAAAQLLGISRQQLCRKIKDLGLDRSRSRLGRPRTTAKSAS